MNEKMDYSVVKPASILWRLANSIITVFHKNKQLLLLLAAPFIGIVRIISIIPYLAVIPFFVINLIIGQCLKLTYKLPLIADVVRAVNTIVIALARRIMKDRRDVPFIFMTFGVSPVIIGMFFWQMTLPEFNWSLAVLYYICLLGPNKFDFYFRFFVCKHIECHRFQGFYKQPFNFLDRYFECFLGLFYGTIPEIDRCGHIGIHHVHSNNHSDVQSTLLYDRTSFVDFTKYIVLNAFAFNSGIGPLIYFFQHKKWKLFRKLASGMVIYYGLMGLLLWFNWLFAIVYFVVPFFLTNSINAIVTWTWHAFCDPSDPSNYYTGTTTVVNAKGDIMNEHYHLSHHVHPTQHWSEGNFEHYQKNQNLYRDRRATIFQRTDLIEIFLFLTVFKRFDLLAKHYVDLTDRLSQQEIIERLKRQTRPLKPTFKTYSS